jgi:hypothetical protein
MRSVFRWSRTVLISLLLAAAASPALGEAACASDVVFVEMAAAACAVEGARSAPKAQRRRSRRTRGYSLFSAAARLPVPALWSRLGLAVPPGSGRSRSHTLRSSLPIYLGNCVLLR